jgi:hypothetical protein
MLIAHTTGTRLKESEKHLEKLWTGQSKNLSYVIDASICLCHQHKSESLRLTHYY